MRLKKIEEVLNILEKYSKKSKKKKCFLISSTSKKINKSFFVTPIRESKKSFYSGAVVFENKTAEEIAKKIDGKVDYVYVDLEKKISNKKDKLVNIERCVKENIKTSIIKNYKSNDITVNSVETFVNDYFANDARGVGGKNILIIGSGNIGSKVALRLVESGAHINLFRRNRKKLNIISKAINYVKPRYTKAECKSINYEKIDFNDYDVIIGCSNTKFKIKKIESKKVKKRQLILDVGKAVFEDKILDDLSRKNEFIFRIDVESMLSSFIDSTIETESFFKSNFIKSHNEFNLVKKGLLGRKGDIIVDNVDNPKKIIGVCGNEGELTNIDYNKINFLKSKIIKK